MNDYKHDEVLYIYIKIYIYSGIKVLLCIFVLKKKISLASTLTLEKKREYTIFHSCFIESRVQMISNTARNIENFAYVHACIIKRQAETRGCL